MTTHAQFPGIPARASWPRVIKDQRKVEMVALGLMIFSLWFRQVGPWALPLSLAAGIFLGLLNHLVTEYWLLRTITRGDAPTKADLRRSTMLRLAVVSVIAIAIAFAWRPYGVGVLLGLAIFRLIALVMTTIPLLKELKNQ
ncbi:hypothetical protein [Nocardioides ultimimeridianus]|nr:hypothetical protein [Nocardioides sp.]